MAVSSVNFQGNSILVDSYNSQDPLHSDWQTNYAYRGSNYGYYPFADPAGKRAANAVVATDGSFMNVGSAVIYGYLDTATGGSSSVKNGGSIGDTNWIGPNPASPVNRGIQWGHVAADMNVALPNVSLPPSAWAQVAATSSNISGTNYTYVIGHAGNYEIAGTLTGSVYVGASNVVLYLPGGMNLSSGAFTIAADADLTLYSGGPISIGGTSRFNNASQLAFRSAIYGLPSGFDSAGDNVNGCTSINISVSGNTPVTTSVYAPQASLSFSGGGAGTYDVIGAFIVHDVQIDGHFNFHYDEALSPGRPPWLFGQPTNCIVQAGSNATFNVSVLGASLSYQWYIDQTNPISIGSQTPLILAQVQPADAGDYTVIVTNPYGSVTSAPAHLMVYTDPTAVVTNVNTGNGSFSFGVSGVAGLNYCVQTSTNLTDWIPLQTNISPFLFTDTNVALFPRRFFRSAFVQ